MTFHLSFPKHGKSLTVSVTQDLRLSVCPQTWPWGAKVWSGVCVGRVILVPQHWSSPQLLPLLFLKFPPNELPKTLQMPAALLSLLTSLSQPRFNTPLLADRVPDLHYQKQYLHLSVPS